MPIEKLRRAAEWVLRLIYPPKCAFCGALLDRGEADFCGDCAQTLPRVSGFRLLGEERFPCRYPLRYEGPVRGSLLRYKFSGMSCYSRCYGRLLRELLTETGEPAPDLVTWAPLSRKRLRERGYDQALLLAAEAAKLYGLRPVRLLRKVRNTKAQSTLSAKERRENVAGVYAYAGTEGLAEKRVLLVDDILTTGSTLESCARVLMEAGALEVRCLTVAGGRDETGDRKR